MNIYLPFRRALAFLFPAFNESTTQAHSIEGGFESGDMWLLRRHNRTIKYPDFLQTPRQNYSGRKRLAPGTVVKQENGKTKITANIKQEPERKNGPSGGYRMTKPAMFPVSVPSAGCSFVEWIVVEGIMFRLDGNKIK